MLKPNTLNKKRYQDLIDMKEQRKKDFNEKTKLFYFIGLTLSLLFVSTVINWKTYDALELVDLGQLEAEFDDLMEVPISEQPPPPPPVEVITPLIVEVSNEEIIEEIEVNLDVEMTEETAVEDHNISFEVDGPGEEVVEEVFTIVEDYPAPVGGMQAFYTYVGENIEYPTMARRLAVSGIVFVRFVVEKDGSITDVTVVRGIGAGCDEEAVRVIQNAPAWTPGKQRGRPVRVMMTVPIRFVLQESN
jgi:protein TonB